MNVYPRVSRVLLIALSLGVAPLLPAQGFTIPALTDSATLAREMPALASAAGPPLRITFSSRSYLDIPIRR